jgi:hypothetical protein
MASPHDPQPSPAPTVTRIPWVLGLLNVIFGALLIVQTGCGAAFLAVMPYGARALDQFYAMIEGEMQKDWQKRIDSQMEEFDQQAEDAETDEERADIEARRQEVLSRPAPKMPRMSAILEASLPPSALYLAWIGAAIALPLNALLIVSGRKLMKYRRAGRVLAVGVAVGKITMQVSLGAYNILVVQPASAAAVKKMVEEMTAGQGPMVGLDPSMFTPSPVVGGIMAVGGILLACAYPIVLLWLLNRRDVCEACGNGAPGGDLGHEQGDWA